MVDAMEVDEERPAQHAQQAQALTNQQLKQMLDRVIKLTAENKITKENAWDLDAISLMPDIIRSEAAQPDSFNFQRASCGLDASVRIYSKRVDSTLETVFTSLQMTKGVQGPADLAPDDEDDDTAAGSQGDQDKGGSQGGEGGAKPKKGRRGAAQPDLEPSSTLADAETLKDKKADNTFESDPLFNRTTKLFDENSASGLLLLNYPVYRNCHILFNSEDRPLDAFPTPQAQQPAIKQCAKVDLTPLAQVISQLRSSVSGLKLNPSFPLLQTELLSQPVSAAAIKRSALDIINAAFEAEARSQVQPSPLSHGSAQPALGQSAAGMELAHQSEPGHEEEASGWGNGAEASEGQPQGNFHGGATNDSQPSQVGASMVEDAESGGFQQPSPAPVEANYDDGDGAGALGDDGGDGVWGVGSHSTMLDAPIRASGEEASLSNMDASTALQDEEPGASRIQQLLASALAGGRQGGSLTSAGGRRAGAAWAGAAFWRYRPAAQASASAAGVVSTANGKKTRSNKSKAAPADIDFLTPWQPDQERLQMAEDPSMLCAKRTVKASTLRPADTHFEVSRLYKLSCAPALNTAQVWHLHVQYERRQQAQARAAAASQTTGQGWADAGAGGGDDGAEFAGWAGAGTGDDDDGPPGADGQPAAAEFDGPAVHSQEQGTAGAGWDPLSLDFLLPPVRKVIQVDIAYDRTAKQVNVKALKDILWSTMVRLHEETDCSPTSLLSFQQVIGSLPAQSAAGAVANISVHMCLICILHLANEKGLALTEPSGQLWIQMPSAY